MLGLLSQVQWRSNDYFTRHAFTRSLGTSAQGGTKKKYQVLYSVENPPKVNGTEPYRAVPRSGKAPLVTSLSETGLTYPAFPGLTNLPFWNEKPSFPHFRVNILKGFDLTTFLKQAPGLKTTGVTYSTVFLA